MPRALHLILVGKINICAQKAYVFVTVSFRRTTELVKVRLDSTEVHLEVGMLYRHCLPALFILLASFSANVLGASAAFVGTDTATKGSWKGVYGGDGY